MKKSYVIKQVYASQFEALRGASMRLALPRTVTYAYTETPDDAMQEAIKKSGLHPATLQVFETVNYELIPVETMPLALCEKCKQYRRIVTCSYTYESLCEPCAIEERAEGYENVVTGALPAQDAQASEPPAHHISLTADVFNLDYSGSLPRYVFHGHSSQRCLIDGIEIEDNTLIGVVHYAWGDLLVKVMRNMWIACGYQEFNDRKDTQVSEKAGV